MSTTTRVLVALGLENAVLTTGTYVLKRTWFGTGAVGCDDEGVPATTVCYERADWITALIWTELGLAALTVVAITGVVAHRLAGRRSTAL